VEEVVLLGDVKKESFSISKEMENNGLRA